MITHSIKVNIRQIDEIDHLTPLMTFDPGEKKYTCIQAKCIVPV